MTAPTVTTTDPSAVNSLRSLWILLRPRRWSYGLLLGLAASPPGVFLVIAAYFWQAGRSPDDTYWFILSLMSATYGYGLAQGVVVSSYLSSARLVPDYFKVSSRWTLTAALLAALTFALPGLMGDAPLYALGYALLFACWGWCGAMAVPVYGIMLVLFPFFLPAFVDDYRFFTQVPVTFLTATTLLMISVTGLVLARVSRRGPRRSCQTNWLSSSLSKNQQQQLLAEHHWSAAIPHGQIEAGQWHELTGQQKMFYLLNPGQVRLQMRDLARPGVLVRLLIAVLVVALILGAALFAVPVIALIALAIFHLVCFLGPLQQWKVQLRSFYDMHQLWVPTAEDWSGLMHRAYQQVFAAWSSAGALLLIIRGLLEGFTSSVPMLLGWLTWVVLAHGALYVVYFRGDMTHRCAAGRRSQM